METRILADLALFGALVMESNEAGFPENPRIGTFIIKDQCLFGYLKIGDLETWYPFASKTNSYIHTQGLASTTWVVNHMLGTSNVWYQVRDPQGQILGVGKTDIDEDKFSLNFTEATLGTVVVVAPDSINVPTIKATSITIAEGAVEINSGGVFVEGERVLTSANIADDIATAVAPKADQATTYTKTETDSRIQAVVGAAPSALDTLQEIAAQLANDQNAVAALTASVISGDASTLSSANAYTDTNIASEVITRNTAITLATSSTLAAAETYANTNISAALVTASTDATTKANNAIAYTDNVLAVETSARIAADTALTSSISGLSIDLSTKAPLASPTFTGTVAGITKQMVGLGSVDNTTDAAKPISTATQTALDAKAPLANPTFTGTVGGITKGMVGLSNVDNTTDASKPVSSATQTALDAKAPLASPTFTGTVSGVTKTMVGLGNVDNTSDAAKPVSTATQTALDAKAPLLNPSFTGTVSGITKTMIGLGDVDNTTDAAKPVSSATQTALSLKAPLASPTFTGTVSGITKTMVGLGNVDNTSDAAKPVSTATQTALNAKADQATTYTKTETDSRIQAVVGAAPAALDTLEEIAAQLANDQNAVAAITASLAEKAPLASPTFTGTVSGITKAMVGLANVDNTSDATKAVLSATTLQTARTINGVSFNGSANITVADATKLPLAGGTLTGAIAFAAGQAFPASVATTEGTQALANKTLVSTILNDGYTEEVYTIPSSTAPALAPVNGSIQTWALTGNSTPTLGTWNSGQSITLMINAGSVSTVTWPSITWVNNAGSAPTLATTGFTVIALWKVGTVVYGALVGNGT